MGGFPFSSVKIFLRRPHSQKQDVVPVREDHQAKFYEDYRKVAEEYDKEFLKKHEEDLDTTLIFVSPLPSLRPAHANPHLRQVCSLP
jgi:hypothetical protein